MSRANHDRLRSIKTLPQLVAYLRDELDWPIESDAADEITFDYKPADLRLDEKAAVPIQEIRQLRPLVTRQPWGIFFISFEKRRLPVVAMRRILRALAFHTRESANHAERQAWRADDLLFISAYGDDSDRELTFAHFVDRADTNLAELRVLGWDDDDTPLKLDYVVRTLKEKLRWREEFADDPELWRAQWSDAFRLCHGYVIRTSAELASELATLARRIRARVSKILEMEADAGEIRTLQRAFRIGLIHDLDDGAFADMFAQTITYGLFSLACRRTHSGAGTAFVKEDLTQYFTSPFLKEMLGIFLGLKSRKGRIDFDELGISDVTDLLTSPDTRMEAILIEFGNRNYGEDPVIHFYEDFLGAYDKPLKNARGVFYTPQPVVSYIVRGVHELLQTEFGLVDGLADTTTWGEMVKRHPTLKLPPKTDESDETHTFSPDEPFVQILDPATGTATFLVETINVIHHTLVEKWKKQGWGEAKRQAEWNAYVPRHLLPRLHAFELMMAPYAIAHMKVGLKLAETGYRFEADERARIYLTNALEPKVSQLPQLGFDALAREATEVNEIKWYRRFTVVIGNPPYAGYSANGGAWIEHLMEGYKTTVRTEERQIQRLSNDYVKFVRYSESILTTTGVGCLGFITDSGYLNGILFRDMRSALRAKFQQIWIRNLHGVAMRGSERHTGIDENVFDITQGVAISLFIRGAKSAGVNYAELFGARKAKYLALARTTVAGTDWAQLSPSPPKCLFVPLSSDKSYDRWPILTEIIGTGAPKIDRDSRYGTGIKTRHDEFAIGWTPQDAVARVKQIAHRKESDSFLIKDLGLCTTAHFSIREARKRAGGANLLSQVKSIAYRPFDRRSLVYLREFICEPKAETMRHMLEPTNLAMAVLRRDRKENGAGVFVARGLIAKDLVSNLDDALVWPLYLLEDDHGLLRKTGGTDARQPNIARKVTEGWPEKLGLRWCGYGAGDLITTVGPEAIFGYIYAILYSRGYRGRYAESLKIDFPRLPLTENLELFRALAHLGGELVALHLLESSRLEPSLAEWIGGSSCEVEKVFWVSKTVWLNKAQTQGLRGIPQEVWEFEIGGYQVCEKWLKDRKGRVLTEGDIAHYQKIVAVISESLRLMAEIDQVIEKRGGWPGAFTTGILTFSAAASEPMAASARNRERNSVLRATDELPLG